MTTVTSPLALECRECHERYPVEPLTICEECFGPLEPAYDLQGVDGDQFRKAAEAGPSTPVQIIGLSTVPESGQSMHAVETERDARDVADHRAGEERSKPSQTKPKLTLEELFGHAEGEGPKELRIVLKGDVHGTVERMLADGGTVAQEVTWRGTHQGPLETPGGTVPPTGASVTIPATLWMSVNGDAVAEVHHHLDVLSLLAQIGALPA